MVYNQLDQVVATQDGVQRGKTTQEWTFTKYDGLGRIAYWGIYQYPSSTAGTSYRAALQTTMDGETILWETAQTTGTGYNGTAWPHANITRYLQLNYYDNYTFPGNPYVPTISGSLTSPTSLLTASKTAVLLSDGTYGSMLWSVNYYDAKGQLIQALKQHYLGGEAAVNNNNYDEVDNSYDFTGAVTQSTRHHYVAGTQALWLATGYTFDHMGRKLQTTEAIASGTNSLPASTILSQVTYNEIGQLWNKKLHSENSGGSFLQNTTYAYNERAWLSKINDPATAPTAQTMFTMQLGYNSGSSPQYNGNIASQQWYSYQGSLQTFNYSYDKLNMLTSGVSGTMAETGITYDLQGNIQFLKRDANATYGYAYFTGTNQLKSVSGLTTGNYVYDVNGNMKTDARTGAGLTYNLLNLPATAVKTGTGAFNIAYTYDASGQKLRKVSGTSTTDYINGIQYDNLSGTNGIDFIQTEEGRATRRTDGTYRYDYDLADHLGNTRVSFFKDPNTQAATVMQADNYYPFGMRSAGGVPGTNHYLYNKKELQDETGDYDYGARFYDPVIGRFITSDPYSEKYPSLSSYQYAGLNPIKNVDMNGDSVKASVTWVLDLSFIGGQSTINTTTVYYEGGDAYNQDGSKYAGSSTFFKQVGDALTNISNGADGKEMVDYLEKSTNNTTINQDTRNVGNSTTTNGNDIQWGPTNQTGAADKNGVSTRDPFIGLAHELGHVENIWKGKFDSNSWFTDSNGNPVPNSDKWATYRENQVRAEHGATLREYYEPAASGGRIIDNKGFNLWVRPEQITAPKMPSIRISPATIPYRPIKL